MCNKHMYGYTLSVWHYKKKKKKKSAKSKDGSSFSTFTEQKD
jgi:hypothetical protein